MHQGICPYAAVQQTLRPSRMQTSSAELHVLYQSEAKHLYCGVQTMFQMLSKWTLFNLHMEIQKLI